ncbi:hypothetical protein COB11_02085 [Candidatus Aerophobetes bacterium]|uniref:Serine aminopeptidase S33 domain-containing protein n=1 Tax=Aerophobetes bacterium TaxID=2030807 RepID=A0A2A4YL94_UNCAE|nr:MAG: hypothetical protein COB11_02085 [Candidatus Aerophobetes bacterium]
MVNVSTTGPFQAVWTASNSTLKYPEYTGVAYLANKVKGMLLYLPNSLVALCVNPRGAYRTTSRTIFESERSKGYSKEIITPDNVTLFAKIYIAEGSTKDTKTTILFNPLGTNSDVRDHLQTTLIHEKTNVVTFNYRGLGNTWRAKDLVVDGESVYQFVVDELGINKDSVNMYGHSLGGAVATSVKALHQDSKGKLVADRAFKSVYSLLTENLCISRFGRVVKKITSLVLSIFIAYPVYLLGWEWNNERAICDLTSDKLVIFHPNDVLVTKSASLASVCESDDVLELDRSEFGGSTHFAPLSSHNTQNGERAKDVVVDFLKG